MDIYKLNLGVKNGIIDINIIRKPIKNVHLKVYRDLKVNLSIPNAVPDEWINTFLNDRIDWIDKQISKYKQSSGYNNLTEIKSGSSTQYLGKDMRIYKKASIENEVKMDEKSINVFLKDADDEDFANKLFNKFWRKQATEIFDKELSNIYEKVFKKYKIEKPGHCKVKMKKQLSES